MKNINIYLIALILVLGLWLGYTITSETYSNVFGSAQVGESLKLISPTHGSTSLSAATSTEILAVDTGYTYGRFCNASSTGVAYLAIGADAASSTGIYLAPQSCWPEDGAKILLGGRLEGTANGAVTLIHIYE